MTRPVRVALFADFLEEGWPSMDRVAAMLARELEVGHAGSIDVTLVRPAFRRRATRVAGGALAVKVDRGLNRLWDYPRAAAAITGRFDVFHVVDHSYAQLVHRLPAARTVVTCHDLDTFRSVLVPGEEPRSAVFRAMTRHILAGLRRAAVVACDTAAVRDELVARGMVPAARTAVVPVGVSSTFSHAPDAGADELAGRLLDVPREAVLILHVGSTAPRKRIDVLLGTCGALRREVPDVWVVRVGAPLTSGQRRDAKEAGLADRLRELEFVDDATLAAVYRRAALVLQPSDREGFGLPVAEAMACGTMVVASDIPVLREVGGGAAEYCPPGDLAAWRQTVAALLAERRDGPDSWRARQARARQRAGSFTWPRFAADMADLYAGLALSSPSMS